MGKDKLIFIMDITSLYTDRHPKWRTSSSLQTCFFTLRTVHVKEPNSETLLRLAELVLTLNCFLFSDNYYNEQISGVVVGTKMGPSYANLFVATLNNNFQSIQRPKT